MKLSEMKSKELYGMLTQEQRDKLSILRMHYNNNGASIWEDCGLIRAKEIKQDKTLSLFSMRYNRKNLLKYVGNSL